MGEACHVISQPLHYMRVLEPSEQPKRKGPLQNWILVPNVGDQDWSKSSRMPPIRIRPGESKSDLMVYP